jgi:ribonuclease D
MKNDLLIRPGFDRRMTREEINRCPVARWEGPVEVVRSEKQLNRAAEELGRERVLGFDTETRPAFKKGQKYSPALVQLAGEKRVYLFQLRHCGFREPLAALLADPAIIKAGVSLAYDLKELRALAPFNAAGFTELADLAGQKGIKNNGLRGLAAVVLGLRITKSAQTTNWARKELTESQIRYAATDAWVGRELYFRLLELPDKRQ